LGFFIPLCMFAGVWMAFKRGRKWCDWYCPRGSFYDVWVSNISPKKDIPELFRKPFFRLGVTALLFAVVSLNLFLFWPDFSRIGLSFVVMATVTTVIGVVLAFFFHQRSWCMVCPVGTVSSLVGGNKLPLKISPLCLKCKQCFKVCPIAIRPYAFKSANVERVKDPECLKCDLCVSVCPKKALYK